ncbi:MAG: outer membrane protein TolC [Chlamydiales bacterium]|jgi:outer membrane protein TolC
MQNRPVDERCSEIERETDGAGPVRRWSRRLLGGAPLFALMLAGCQSYSARPLDPAAHRNAWHARTLEDGSLRAFLGRLALDVGQPAVELDTTDGLSLEEGRLVALAFNPGLRLERMRIGRATVAVEHAGRWADPKFSFTVTRLTGGGTDPWIVSPGLTFSIPLSGRMGVERELANAQQVAAEGSVLEAEWSVWHEVEQAWIAWSDARLRVLETERLIDAMQGLNQTAPQLVQRGELLRTEAALFTLERAQRENQLQRLRGELDATEQELRGLMGLAPAAPVQLIPSMAVVSTLPDGLASGSEMIEAFNPRLERMRREYDVSEETLRHEIKKQYPDLRIGPQFESDEGQSRIGFLGGFPVPFLNANRRAIAKARVDREIARVALETEYELLVGRWSVAKTRALALSGQRQDMEQVLVPLADAQLEDTIALMRLGEGDGLATLESLVRTHQIKLDLIEARASEALARAESTYLIGPATAAWPFEAENPNP